jgi:hypothetical protein
MGRPQVISRTRRRGDRAATRRQTRAVSGPEDEHQLRRRTSKQQPPSTLHCTLPNPYGSPRRTPGSRPTEDQVSGLREEAPMDRRADARSRAPAADRGRQGAQRGRLHPAPNHRAGGEHMGHEDRVVLHDHRDQKDRHPDLVAMARRARPCLLADRPVGGALLAPITWCSDSCLPVVVGGPIWADPGGPLTGDSGHAEELREGRWALADLDSDTCCATFAYDFFYRGWLNWIRGGVLAPAADRRPRPPEAQRFEEETGRPRRWP